MFAIKKYIIPIFITASSLLSLLMALIAQYGFELEPCKLCIWQRWPYAINIALGIAMFILAAHSNNNNIILKTLLLLTILVFLSGSAIGVYHAGIEYGWWQEITSCVDDIDNNIVNNSDLSSLKAEIFKQPIAACDQPEFVLFGISMAGYNAIWSLLLALVLVIAMLSYKNHFAKINYRK